MQLVPASMAAPDLLAGRLIGKQIFTASGTYTATPGTTSVIVEVQAPGGGSGGCVATAASQWAAGRSGGGGGYALKRLTSGFDGQTVTIGAPGIAAVAGDNGGGNGGVTSFGAIITCNGGGGGGGSGPSAQTSGGFIQNPAAGGSASGGDINIPGGSGSVPFAVGVNAVVIGPGGASFLSTGAAMRTVVNNNTNGQSPAGGYGGGASGPAQCNGVFSAVGGAVGGPGIVIITEFA